VVKWALVFTSQAGRDAKTLARAGLKPHAERPLEILTKDPYQTPPPYERLLGDLAGACSRRINIHHRLVYQVLTRLRLRPTRRAAKSGMTSRHPGPGFHRGKLQPGSSAEDRTWIPAFAGMTDEKETSNRNLTHLQQLLLFKQR